MSAESKIIPAEALRSEAIIKRAPVVTATELLGGKVEEFGGLKLAESPIHGFRIERPTGVEVLAVMPDVKLGSDAFLGLLQSSAPHRIGKIPDRYDVVADYLPLDPNNENKSESLLRLHSKMGSDWIDFMKHFSLFGQTIMERDEDIAIKEIARRGKLGGGGLDFQYLQIRDKIWATQDPVNISVYGGRYPDEATLELRNRRSEWKPRYEGDEVGGYIDYFDDSDEARKSLKLKIEPGSILRITFEDTFQAVVRRRFTGRHASHREDLVIDELTSTNVLVPTFHLGKDEDGERSWIIDPVENDKELGLLDEFIEGYSLPPELRFDRQRFNPLVGLLTAAHLSPEITADWPKEQQIGNKGRPNQMGAAQVPVLALQRRGELVQSPFAKALAEHVERNAA